MAKQWRHWQASLLVAISVSGTVPVAAGADEAGRQALHESFVALADDPHALHSAFAEFLPQLPPTHQELAMAYRSRILRMPEFADAVFDFEQSLPGSMTDAELMDQGMLLAAKLQLGGIPRLPEGQRDFFLDHLTGFVAWLAATAPDDCKAIVTGTMTDILSVSVVEGRYVAELDVATARDVFDLYGDALNAELTGLNPPRPVSADEATSAEEAYTAAILAAIAARPDADRFYAAAVDLAAAPAADVCAWGEVSFQAMADLSASEREIIFRSILAGQP
jgi:hypothetical protein